MTLQATVAIFLAFQLSAGWAAAPAIGVISAKGSFRIDNAPAAGNGTLFEGTTVETSRAAGEIRLANGARMQLGSESRGRVYRNHMVLERGSGELSGAAPLQASSLRVISEGAGSIGRVTHRANHRILVAALAGSLRVTNTDGVLLAALPAGRSLEFEPQAAGAAGPTTVTGCVFKREGKYFLSDETTNVTFEIRGSRLEEAVGHRMEVTGSQVPGATPAATASQVIQAGNMKELSKKCGVPAGAIAGAGAGAGAGAAGAAIGMAAATKAVIAGVVVAAATGATVAAVKLSDDDAISQR